MVRVGLALVLTVPMLADASAVMYEGNVFPEDAGFERFATYDPDRWIDDGWFVQEIEQGAGPGGPFGGERDTYHYDLPAFAGEPFFIEWRLLTDAPNSEVDGHNGAAILVLVGGPVTYHFNIASGLARILRGYPYPTLYFDIAPGVPHTYRLEVYRGDYFEFTIDGAVKDAGFPEDDFPTADALLSFGSRYYLSPHTTQWDYVRFGTIPEPATINLLLLAAFLLPRRWHRTG